jgi:hypothetical protein
MARRLIIPPLLIAEPTRAGTWRVTAQHPAVTHGP